MLFYYHQVYPWRNGTCRFTKKCFLGHTNVTYLSILLIKSRNFSWVVSSLSSLLCFSSLKSHPSLVYRRTLPTCQIYWSRSWSKPVCRASPSCSLSVNSSVRSLSKSSPYLFLTYMVSSIFYRTIIMKYIFDVVATHEHDMYILIRPFPKYS